MRYCGLLLGLSFCVSAFASEPGQPIDCSDWVALLPGYTCSEVLRPCPSGSPQPFACRTGNPVVVDNEGKPIIVQRTNQGPCGNRSIFVQRFDDTNVQTIGYFAEKCNGPLIDQLFPALEFQNPGIQGHGATYFDEEGGRLLIPFRSACNFPGECPHYPQVEWLAGIDGFATSFEILQTYSPVFHLNQLPRPLHARGPRRRRLLRHLPRRANQPDRFHPGAAAAVRLPSFAAERGRLPYR